MLKDSSQRWYRTPRASALSRVFTKNRVDLWSSTICLHLLMHAMCLRSVWRRLARVLSESSVCGLSTLMRMSFTAETLRTEMFLPTPAR